MSAQACHSGDPYPYGVPAYPYYHHPYDTHPMPWQYGSYSFTPYPITEERIREILREELRAVLPKL